MRSVFPFAAFVVFLQLALTVNVAADPTPAEILAKHYASIGPENTIGQVKSIFAGGTSTFEARMPIVRGGGKAVVVSDASNLYFLMSLNSREYPFEKIGMFGDRVSVPFLSSGNRSFLGTFLVEHPRILSDNVFCGVLSLRWINNVAAGTKLKLAPAESKKINGRKAYGIEVLTGASSDEFKMRIYFDAETFRHVRSVYKRNVPVRSVTFGRQNQFTDSTVELTEDFADFRNVEGLTLPFDYKVTFVSNSGDQTYTNVWGISIINYLFNQKLDKDFFTFDPK